MIHIVVVLACLIPTSETADLVTAKVKEAYLALGSIRSASGKGSYREEYGSAAEWDATATVEARFQTWFTEQKFHLHLSYEKHPGGFSNNIIMGNDRIQVGHAWKRERTKHDFSVLNPVDPYDPRPLRQHAQINPISPWLFMCDLAKYPEERWKITGKVGDLWKGVTYREDGKTISSEFLVDPKQGYLVVSEKHIHSVTGKVTIEYKAQWKETPEGWYCSCFNAEQIGKITAFKRIFEQRKVHFEFTELETDVTIPTAYFTFDSLQLLPGTAIADFRFGTKNAWLKYQDEIINPEELDRVASQVQLPSFFAKCSTWLGSSRNWMSLSCFLAGLLCLGFVGWGYYKSRRVSVRG